MVSSYAIHAVWAVGRSVRRPQSLSDIPQNMGEGRIMGANDVKSEQACMAAIAHDMTAWLQL
ncbi:hypothetical protein D7V89_02280 [Bifidobacterium pseudolongum]|uniref:Uncharacterized protein n=1 Tax=Bifidobacterium pseudolongum TaxID=1694 RepID=A0AB37P1Y1_9BIFI|nr:hypothetical protein [Bifidobacterium pseudolongum]RKI89181.1 hypothetical protein D7V89_02280 [Bifidobacterium pseudolongum]